jgi:Ankyrin repeats (many copies)
LLLQPQFGGGVAAIAAAIAAAAAAAAAAPAMVDALVAALITPLVLLAGMLPADGHYRNCSGGASRFEIALGALPIPGQIEAMSKSLPAMISEAVNAGDLPAIRQLFSSHPDQLDAQTFFGGQTWLGYAAQKGQLGVIQALAALGADINRPGREGVRPIVVASSFGHADVAAWLLANSAVLDTGASVRNPLFGAITGQSPQIVQMLLAAGIDASVRYHDTWDAVDALAFALMRGEADCANVIANHLSVGDAALRTRLLAEADQIAERNAHPKRRRG